MERFCLSLPDGMLKRIYALAQPRGMTKTSYIRGSVSTRIQSELTGQRYCTDGTPCVLAYLPNLQNHAVVAKKALAQDSLTGSGL